MAASTNNVATGSLATGEALVQYLTGKLHRYIQEDDLPSIKDMMRRLDRDLRRSVVSQKCVGNPPLFAACWLGKVEIVKFLLDECDADIEQEGIYEVEEDQSKHRVTPLWCAAVSNKLDVVKALTERKANVNSPSDTESTPVRSACYMTNIDCIKYLVDHGGDIHKPNVNGGTCLINAVQSADLCKYLIEKGANVNDHDSSGNLALHYAVREGRLETVKLLVAYDTKIHSVNDFGDDALQTAALRGHQEIMTFLMKQHNDLEKKIHAHELLGTSLIDDKHDITGGINMWKEAMRMRYQDPENVIQKNICEKPNPAYGNILEPRDMKELENLSNDPESIYMQSLLIRERILGSSHKDTTFGLMYRGAVYADTQNYQKCVDLWKYALQLRGGKDIHSHECLLTLQALAKLFWEMDTEYHSDRSGSCIKFEDALDVFSILVHYIRTAEEPGSSNKRLLHLSHEHESKVLMKLSLHMVNLLQRQKKSKEETSQFHKLVREVIKINQRDVDQKTLLHFAVHVSSSLISEELYSHMPNLETVETLVACGANLEAQDRNKNTVLMDFVEQCSLDTIKNERDIFDFLLENGSHLDSCNMSGSTPLQVLHSMKYPLSSLQYINLKCLACRVIMKHKINFVGLVPSSLTQFILKHG